MYYLLMKTYLSLFLIISVGECVTRLSLSHLITNHNAITMSEYLVDLLHT